MATQVDQPAGIEHFTRQKTSRCNIARLHNIIIIRTQALSSYYHSAFSDASMSGIEVSLPAQSPGGSYDYERRGGAQSAL